MGLDSFKHPFIFITDTENNRLKMSAQAKGGNKKGGDPTQVIL